MSDADDAELLTPTLYRHASRATYPRKRAAPRNAVDGGDEMRSKGGMNMKVVYDRQFDRFFLRDEWSLLGEHSAPATSPKPRQARGRRTAVKHRSLAAGVQWEDLLLPPRSVPKRYGGVSISDNDARHSQDAPSTQLIATELSVPRVEEATVRPSQSAQALAPPSKETVGSAQPSPWSVGQGVLAQSVPSDAPMPSITSTNSELPERQSTLDPLAVSIDATPAAASSLNALTPEAEALIDGGPVVHPSVETPSISADETVVAPSLSILERPAPSTQAVVVEDLMGGLTNGLEFGAATSIERTRPGGVDPVTRDNEAPSPFIATVRLLRFLYRQVRRRRAILANASVVLSPAEVVAPVEAFALAKKTPRIDAVALDERLTSGINMAAAQPSTSPVVALPFASTTPALNAVDQPLHTHAPASLLPATLQLDLSKLTTHSPRSQRQSRTSPVRKSPTKKARVPNYARHFENAAAATEHVPDTSCLRLNNQHQHTIRWQGDVIHVAVEVPGSDDWPSVAPPARPTASERSDVPLSHVYSLRELARIRPHGDGFRRVNEACTFTALTSSSESSEDDDEPLAVVDVPSSSDDDDDGITFQRGDTVLFYARHRWFHGTVLRRIQQSWFYDVRAANGTVFEAIQAKRMRHFDGDDDEPQFVFEVGDRVLWCPTDDAQKRERQQNYKARIVAIRRGSTRGQQKRAKHPAKRYDLELLTGRVVKKVHHEELRPLRRYYR